MRVLGFTIAGFIVFGAWPFLTTPLLDMVAGEASFAARLMLSKVILCLVLAGLLGAMSLWTPIGFTAPRGLRGWLSTLPLWAMLGLMYLSQGQFGQDGLNRILLVFIPLAMATSFSEEVLTRGALWEVLRPLGAWPLVLITSAVFGSLHLMGLASDVAPVLILAQSVMAFSVGLVLAATRLAAGSLWTPILVHFVFNALAFAINGFSADAGPMSTEIAPQQIAAGMIVMALIVSVCGLLACFLALRAERRRSGKATDASAVAA
jgi:membrane protease YdiL (CAAX protease family)